MSKISPRIKTYSCIFVLTATILLNVSCRNSAWRPEAAFESETKANEQLLARNWPREVTEVKCFNRIDSTYQPALFYKPNTNKPRPLLVGLHTWSGSYLQSFSIHYANWCIDNDWVFIHPHFRGHNKNPEATGSELVIEDILSAVDYAKAHANVSKVYLIGSSGGGYTALLMAARAPEVWTAVSAWVPISSLQDWYNQCVALKCEEHTRDIVLSCGGVPGQSKQVDMEYAKRSPISYLNPEIEIPIDINAGIRDGHHSGGVGINHSLNAFNLLAKPEDVIAVEDIKYMTYNSKVPGHLARQIYDPLYCDKEPLFRKTSGNKRVTIFSGTHEMVWEAGLKWLAQQ